MIAFEIEMPIFQICFYACYFTGREVRASADIRRKEAYRKELESQMAELKAAKKK